MNFLFFYFLNIHRNYSYPKLTRFSLRAGLLSPSTRREAQLRNSARPRMGRYSWLRLLSLAIFCSTFLTTGKTQGWESSVRYAEYKKRDIHESQASSKPEHGTTNRENSTAFRKQRKFHQLLVKAEQRQKHKVHSHAGHTGQPCFYPWQITQFLMWSPELGCWDKKLKHLRYRSREREMSMNQSRLWMLQTPGVQSVSVTMPPSEFHKSLGQVCLNCSHSLMCPSTAMNVTKQVWRQWQCHTSTSEG